LHKQVKDLHLGERLLIIPDPSWRNWWNHGYDWML